MAKDVTLNMWKKFVRMMKTVTSDTVSSGTPRTADILLNMACANSQNSVHLATEMKM